MKNRFRTKVLFAAASMSIVLLNGCSNSMQTQEELVVSKEQGEGASGAATDTRAESAGSVSEQVQAPEVYQMEASSDKIHLKADATVIIPDVPGIKTKKVTPRVFTQEDYDAVNRVLLDGAELKEPYSWESDSKEIIPAVVPYDVAQSLFGVAAAHGWDYFVQVDNDVSPEMQAARFMVDRQDGDGNGNFMSFSKELPDLEHSEHMLKPGLENMNIPPEEVRAQAKEAMKQMELGEYALQGGCYFASWSADDADPNRTPYVTSIGYGINFCRVVDGVPVIFTYGNGTMVEDGDTTFWPCEELQLIYDNDGFQGFDWMNPYAVEDLSAEYVFLMPFSDISEIFEKMLVKEQADSFKGSGSSAPETVDALEQNFKDKSYTADILVKEVRLSYMRVREKNSLEGTLIPVWDFFGVQTYKDADGEVYKEDDSIYDSILTINAMDGTIIDRYFGY